MEKKKYTVEFEIYWFDDNITYYEQVLNIKCFDIKEAETMGKQELNRLDEIDNKGRDEMNPMVSRDFRLCCLSKYFSYDSSAKEPIFEVNPHM